MAKATVLLACCAGLVVCWFSGRFWVFESGATTVLHRARPAGPPGLHAFTAAPHASQKVCGYGSRVPCVTLIGGVQMPLVTLGTGASSYLGQCDDPGPHPPFRNVTCFKQMAFRSAVSWLGMGGAALETAQVDRNMIPVGQAVESTRVPREGVFLETKCWGSQGFSATLECAADSLQMFGTTYIDLLILHHPYKPSPGCWGSPVWDQPCSGDPLYDPGAAVRQASWRALEVLLRAGTVRAIGLSDFSEGQIEEILEVANVTPAVLQTHWAPGAHNDTLLAYCRRKGITLQGWGALSAGQWGPNILKSPTLRSVAAAHNVTTAQAALAWSVQQGVAVVAGTGNPDHMKSDMDIFNFTLSEEELRKISDISVATARDANSTATHI